MSDRPVARAPVSEQRTRALLDFERDWQAHEGRKQEAIQQRFGITAARYYQLLAKTLDDPGAEAHDPLTVRRLRRRRAERARRRAEQVTGERSGP